MGLHGRDSWQDWAGRDIGADGSRGIDNAHGSGYVRNTLFRVHLLVCWNRHAMQWVHRQRSTVEAGHPVSSYALCAGVLCVKDIHNGICPHESHGSRLS